MDPVNNKLLAQVELAPSEGLHGPGPLNPLNSSTLGTQIAGVISTVLGILTALAGVWFLIEITVAGFLFISAGNDQEKLKEAKSRTVQALIGLVIVIGAILLGNLVAYMSGVNFLDIGGFIDNLSF